MTVAASKAVAGRVPAAKVAVAKATVDPEEVRAAASVAAHVAVAAHPAAGHYTIGGARACSAERRVRVRPIYTSSRSPRCQRRPQSGIHRGYVHRVLSGWTSRDRRSS